MNINALFRKTNKNLMWLQVLQGFSSIVDPVGFILVSDLDLTSQVNSGFGSVLTPSRPKNVID